MLSQNNSNLTIDLEGKAQLKYKFTKIIATIGPKTQSKEMLSSLMDEGMNVVRLNLSHASREFCQNVIDNLKEVIKTKGGRRCAIMIDLQGPEIRTGQMEKKITQFTTGKEIRIVGDAKFVGNENGFGIDYPNLDQEVKEGSVILIADGALQLTVKSVNADKSVTCIVNNTTTLAEHKTAHIVGNRLHLPSRPVLSDKDRDDIQYSLSQGADLFACSVSNAAQANEIRAAFNNPDAKLISKIESIRAIENFDEILEASDGIMIARGYLGMVLPLEQIFVAQKLMISKCNAASKPVITAKQMLESMNVFPRPTRAEATDVCNAILDGTDAVMLSNETALGEYPIESVRYMRLMCKEAERVGNSYDIAYNFENLRKDLLENPSIPEVVGAYAVRVASDIKADLMILITESGTSARQLCKFRPQIPVICVTNSISVANYLLLSRATIPHVVEDIFGSDILLKQAMERAKNLQLAKVGSFAVCVSGVVEGASGQTNMVRILTVN